MSDEWERARLSRDARQQGDPARDAEGTQAFVGQVVSPASAIAAGNFMIVAPATIGGAEAEGQPATIAVDANPYHKVPVWVVGPGVPSTYDHVVCHFVRDRWATMFGGHGGAYNPYGVWTIPSCFCTDIPGLLVMTSTDEKANYGMFRNCTIRYQPTPAWASPLNLGPNVFLSDQSFSDPLLTSSPFYYLLTCRYNQFALTRLYPVSPYGSPYRDAILYTWLIGGYGNTCHPFHLDNGLAFPGSDPYVTVGIDEPA